MKRLFYILFCLALLGCNEQDNVSRPDGLVPESKMAQILADVHVMESLIEAHVNYPDTAAMVYNREHKLILEKYDVDSEDFYKSYEYYSDNLPAMDKLYEAVLDTLTSREVRLETTKPAETDQKVNTAKLDSLHKAKRPDLNRRSLEMLKTSPELEYSN